MTHHKETTAVPVDRASARPASGHDHEHADGAAHAQDHGHEHGHEHAHEHGDEHGHEPDVAGGHEHRSGWLGRLRELVAPHSHDAAVAVDSALESSAQGIRALQLSLIGLGITAVLQLVVVALSGSVALLGDTLHNFADALTAVPLWIAFRLGRRPATDRYTYGYGRAEDLAGIIIVVVIAASAVFAGYESVRRLLDPRDIDHVPLVMLAGVIGFVGNELVARYRINTGKAIGSAALVADGLHARTDGFTSLAVLVGAIGVALGIEQADAVVGLLITGAIVVVLRGAAHDIYLRLMDAVDPALVHRVRSELAEVDGVLDVGETRLRWIGHQLRAEATVVVDAAIDVVAAHEISERAQHHLLHEIPRLTTAVIHADPWDADGQAHHAITAHHREAH